MTHNRVVSDESILKRFSSTNTLACAKCHDPCGYWEDDLFVICDKLIPTGKNGDNGHNIFNGVHTGDLTSTSKLGQYIGDLEELVGDFSNKNHYCSKSGTQVVDVLEDFDITERYKWNIAKYVLRAGKKPGVSELKDLTKLRNYTDRRINELEAQGEKI